MPSSTENVPQPQQSMEMVPQQDAIISQQPTTEPQPEMATTEGTLRGGFVEECSCCCCSEECACC
ncbi:hypothetical protein GE21DRAFT_1081 [Neurospora crassa]|uniref:Uncharacterized protein n=1 Tax=Neurospora crassa (strain ATCC 24698 / 74-OR23-1A / CBS 708.71 / DSM 1257 / FGSC 987) TaxID=367110 RepID=Q7S025_NEUCR|nr:hypothetical protein NCU10069 [Neurospora crassa OR74A]EAA28644.3 hypothetical protein NCU10069 [Neurospora crassa OR74A]KHE82341.1 hypothetical protein GE21DRAFT_1081 [Neurospora crassa]|eukprot:XP_957880.3 hypothetical protein NCU10069 [Neurospora crassa OR74A]